jgi:hypothetical protein
MLAVEHADAVPWLVLAAGVLAAWGVLFAILASATRPRLPEPGPETMELGPEPPAITNFLVNRCKITTSALSATLVDLAARRYLTLDQIGDGQNLVRLRGQGEGTTTACDKKVLDLVQGRAKNRSVPANELSLGYGKNAEQWWKKFQGDVVAHARDLGLARRRFTPAQVILLAATLAVPFAIAGVGFEFYGAAERAAGKKMDAGSGFAVAAGLWLVALTVGGAKLRAWRETPAGSAAAARWLGVRNFLRHDESFQDAPPAGVAIWDRLLAYGVALGVAHGTDAALPIGPTRDDEGWSPYRGLWRQVRIKYPHRFGYGESPGRAALFSALVLAGALVLGVVVAREFVPPLIDIAGDVGDERGGNGRWLIIPIAALLSVPLVFVLVHVVRRVVMMRRALPDLRQTETFEGYVVRVPWHYEQNGDDRVWAPSGYTAVDDGKGDEIRALRYYAADVHEGQVVRVTMTPRMRHVIRVEAVPDGAGSRADGRR